MTKRFFRYPKKGNVILIAICVIVALLILLASFLKSTTSRMHTTKKLNDTMLAREFANSLALLSSHYIKVNELKNPESELRKVLSLPYDKMEKKNKEDITDRFKKFIKEKVNNGSDDILSLLEKESGLKDLKWTLEWYINKGDFKTINVGNANKPAYPCEKTGLIRYCLTVSHKLPGSKSRTTEDYVYVSSVKIVANIFPVLSKFTFYIENALENEEPDDTNTFRFNVIDTKASGDLKNGATIRPWVLNNGEASSEARNSYDDLVSDPRGFVYIGGGNQNYPLLLGIARGWAESGFGKYGEDFHFFKNERPKAGYWKTVEVWNEAERLGIMTSNIGLCNDVSDDNLSAWQEQMGEYDDKSKYHSIFKLYGTDARKSPTLVLGYVDSVCDSIRILKNASKGNVYFLGNILTEDEFLSGLGIEIDGMPAYSSGYETEEVSEAYKAAFSEELNYEKYNSKLATRLLASRYNSDYTYILTNNMVDYPIERGGVSDEKIKKLCGDTKASNLFCEVPYSKSAKFNELFGDDLTKLDVFLNKELLHLDGSEAGGKNSRLLCSASVKTKEDINKFFTNNRFLDNNKLDLNGFVYLDNKEGVELEINKCEIMSQSGIILSNGNIRIKGDIISNTATDAHLSLLALNGSIIIERGVNKIDASLIAGGGQIKLEGDAKDAELTINGNIIMKKIPRGDVTKDEIGLKRGLYLNYKNELSAIPFYDRPNDDRSEVPLLMFGIKDDLRMLD